VGEVHIENVSDTAFWVAHYRAVESARPDALFRDPLAARLAGERGRKIAQSIPMSFFTAWIIAIRTPLIDDLIREAIADGIDTVVNLGAGLDTRPYRMDLPGTLNWIEVDYPAVIAFKEEQLAGEQPTCRLQRIKLDLAHVDQRREMLARIDAGAGKLLVLTEGVVPYLSVEEAGALADDLCALKQKSNWIVDYIAPQIVKQRQRRLNDKMRNAPFKFAPDNWRGFFEEHGWRLKEMHYFMAEAARRQRPFPLPPVIKLMWGIRSLFMSRARREAIRKSAGFALLEPLPRT
jgi:methyltransferase (TIGR00027 family)